MLLGLVFSVGDSSLGLRLMSYGVLAGELFFMGFFFFILMLKVHLEALGDKQ